MFHQQKQWNTVICLFWQPQAFPPPQKTWNRVVFVDSREQDFPLTGLATHSQPKDLSSWCRLAIFPMSVFFSSKAACSICLIDGEWVNPSSRNYCNSIPNQKIQVEIILECSIICFFLGPFGSGFLTNNSPLGASLTIMFFFFVSPFLFLVKGLAPWTATKGQAREYLGVLWACNPLWLWCCWNSGRCRSETCQAPPGYRTKQKSFEKSEWNENLDWIPGYRVFMIFCGYRCQVVTVFVFSLPLQILLLFPFRGWAGGSHLNMLPRRWLQRIPWIWQARKGGTHFFGMQVVVISRPWKSSQTAKSKKFPKCVA